MNIVLYRYIDGEFSITGWGFFVFLILLTIVASVLDRD